MDSAGHQQALLGTDDVEVGAGIQSFTATQQGHLFNLRLSPEGSVSMQQVDDKAGNSCQELLASLCRAGGPPTQIPEGDVVGATTDGSELRIWHAPLTGEDGPKPTRHLRHTPPLVLDSPAAAQQAAAQLRAAACWAGLGRPPRLLVIVNPASGPGKGPAMYESRVRPMLEAAGVEVEMHLTKARAHATELVQKVQAGRFDAIAAIGGDGTTHEVLQGLLARPDWEAMRGTPLVQIPCGSGNALAASVGLWSVDTAVHAVIKGQRRAFDIASVLQQSPPRRCFSFLSINYGMITNLDIGTEHLRWMGGTRFVVGALQQILLKKKHAARVAILDAESVPAGAAGAAGGGGGAAHTVAAAAAAGGAEQQQLLAAAAALQGPPVRHLAAFQQLSAQQLPPGWEWLPDPEVTLFAATNLPRLDMNFHFAPEATLDSGHYNLIWTPPATRRHGFAVLTASERGEHIPLVKQRRVTAMTLEPQSTGTWLVVDGEEVPFTPLFMEVHPGLCQAIVAPVQPASSSGH